MKLVTLFRFRLKAELEQRERRLKEQVSSLSEKLSRGETGAKDSISTRKTADKGTVLQPKAFARLLIVATPLKPACIQVRKHLAEQKEALALEHGQRLALLRGARSSLLRLGLGFRLATLNP